MLNPMPVQSLQVTAPSAAVSLAPTAHPAATNKLINQQRLRGNFALIMTCGLIVYPLRRGINTIGRELDCRIILAEPAISRRHAQIAVDGNVLILVDLGSTNGTFVNGTRVTSSRILQGGDRVRLGTVEFIVAA